MSGDNRTAAGTDAPAVAVIGVAGRFPGAPDVESFWPLLRDGVEAIKFFTDAELLAAGESPEKIADPAYVRACGQLAGIDQFDASFFGMSPRDAAVFDPQHRLFLECAYQVFEDAGYVGERIDGRVAVFGACGAAEYMMYNLVRNRQVMETVGAWLVRHNGNDPNFLATRVSYELNLSGPSMNVQTACSSSLVAVHLACQSLLGGECDVALAGGSTVYPEQSRGYLYKEGEILSPDGHCRAFDARSAGTVMSSAVGCVLLKRLEDALRDGDRVLAVVRGSAVNNDGSSKVGYLAPSVSGQASVVLEALAVSGVDAEDVSYVEAHGTGTLIGDPIEVTALTEAYRASTSKSQFCAIGSLKTNIGHTGEAAGICGFIKVVLSLVNRQIPPSLHYEKPNPQIDFASSPFFVNSKLRPWTVPPGKSRIAGITALGAGGTNVHVLVQEAPPSPPPVHARRRQLLVLSAKTPTALDEATKNLATHLRAHPELSLADVGFTLLSGRQAFAHRRAVVATTALDAADALVGGDPKRVVSQQAKSASPSVVFMFPGGGAQYARMGAELYADEPVYREAFDACLAEVERPLRDELRQLCLGREIATAEANARLEAPSRSLPAILATEIAVARLLQSWGLTPAALIGHSAGEYAAACLAGVISVRDAVSLVAMRGRLFETLPEGGMLSVSLSESAAREFMGPELSIAAANAPAMCVVSGPVSAVAAMEATLKGREIECTRVHIHVAAHSSMLEPILAEFERFCRQVRFKAPEVPFISNLTGTWITAEQATDPMYWVRHLRNTVRFGEGLERLLASEPRALLEVGPGRTLSSLARQQTTPAAVVATSLRHPLEEASDVAVLLGAVGRLWGAGVALEPKAFCGADRKRVALPTYPFERQRYWVDANVSEARDVTRAATVKQRDVADWFYAPSWTPTPRPGLASARNRRNWLVFTDQSTLAANLVERLRASGDRVVAVAPGTGFTKRGGDFFTLVPGQRADYDRLVTELRESHALPERVLHLWGLGPRPRRLSLRAARSDVLEGYARWTALYHFSLLFFAQAFANEVEQLGLVAVTSHMQAVPGDHEFHPEKALVLGVVKVIAREYANVSAASVDVDYPRSRDQENDLAARLVREVDAATIERGEAALRGAGRWVRRFDRVALRPGDRDWLRQRGVYLVTGGLGGIGLAVAEHLATHARARVVLLGRTPLPPEEAHDDWISAHGVDDETSRRIMRIRSMRAAGAEVSIVTADVTDHDAMHEVVRGLLERFGVVHGVFHTAGVLEDELIALRPPNAVSSVIDSKVKGALVLDRVFASVPLDVFVLFSSVSSILGLPGQADYTAANAFLDAFAHARAAQRPRELTVSIDWNAWQDVGMLARRVGRAPSRDTRVVSPSSVRLVANHPLLGEIVSDEGGVRRFRTSIARSDSWVVAEHVVRGGNAVIPGTGFLEIARAALEEHRESRAVELRDVLFVAPFALQGEEPRAFHVRLDTSRDGSFVVHGDAEKDVFASGKAAYVDAQPAAVVDLATIRARCAKRRNVDDGFLEQHFMEFGPRWGNVRRIDQGEGEALIELSLPDAFVDDLETYRLHPAMLDMATGGAQFLLPGFDPHAAFYVPFSYGRVLLRRGLTRALYSHVRLRAGGTRDWAIFDITLCDPAGAELAAIEGFVMRRVHGTFASAAALETEPASSGHPHVVSSAEEAALRQGMTPREGLEAFDRVLANPVAPRIVVCTVDLQAWVEKVDVDARASTAGAAVPADGPAFSRPKLSTTFVAPRDDIERELARMWRELLGAEEIGVDDDFFELGGQSLVAVRLFHRIGKKFGVELPMATLFQAPTIALCATILRGRLGMPEGIPEGGGSPAAADVAVPSLGSSDAAPPSLASFRALVALQKGGANLLPFFCVHGAGGNVLKFRDLSRAMSRAQPFYGLQAFGVDGVTAPHDTIEDMATAYLAEVRALQPHGPYLLGGYSGGGAVAFEMAKRLEAAGENVRLLALIDTPHPQMPIRRVNHLTVLLGDGLRARVARLWSGGVPYVVEGLRHQRERARALAQTARDEQLIADLRARGEPVPFALRETYLVRNFERAFARYRPTPWDGRAVLFRAAEVDFLFAEGGPRYGWEKDIRGGVDIVKVPGGHHTLVVGANAEVLARALSDAIERVQVQVATRRAS